MSPTPTLGPAQVVGLIEQHFDHLSPELQRAARWVRQHGTALALHSMRGSARLAGVTPATMTRLAQRLGFDGFDALRAPFVRHLAEGRATPVAARSGAGAPALASTLGALNETQRAHVGAVLVANPVPALVAAADAMLGARAVFFLGLRISHGVAFQMHYAYSLLARNGFLLTHLGGTLSDQLLQVTDGCLLVAISQSPYARTTVDAVQTARAQQARLLALTDTPLAPIARGAEHLLLFGGAANSYLHSTSGALALIETLLTVVADRGGERAQRYLAMRRQRLLAERAYWESPTRQPRTSPQAHASVAADAP